MKEIDCKGLSYLNTIRKIKEYFNSIGEGEALVLSGNELGKSNVIRFGMHKGYQIETYDEDEMKFIVKLEKRGCLEVEEEEKIFSILVTSDRFGEGDDELGRILIKDYFDALNEYDKLPKEILFLNSAVKLFDKDCDVLPEINMLHKKGVIILISDTSLDYYNLKENVTFGEITTMYDMVVTMKKTNNLVKL